MAIELIAFQTARLLDIYMMNECGAINERSGGVKEG